MGLEVKSGAGSSLLEVTPKGAAEVTPVERDYSGGVGGGHVLAMHPAAAVAAAIAANTTFAAARFASGSSRKAYIEEVTLNVSFLAAMTAANLLVLGLYKFATATPTGGAAFTPIRKNSSEGGVTDMTDARALQTGLTVTSVTFDTSPVAVLSIGSAVAGSAYDTRIPFDGSQNQPLVLQPGEGLALRNPIQGGAGGTWIFGMRMSWYEK